MGQRLGRAKVRAPALPCTGAATSYVPGLARAVRVRVVNNVDVQFFLRVPAQLLNVGNKNWIDPMQGTL